MEVPKRFKGPHDTTIPPPDLYPEEIKSLLKKYLHLHDLAILFTADETQKQPSVCPWMNRN